jgi:phage repressor protein C with HTH and peptisase S24 domain
MDFAAEVLRRIEELGLNINQAEARAGLPQGYIRGVVRDDDKRAIPSINKAETIANALGLELYFGPRRTPDPEPPTIALDGDEFAAISRVDAEASAGPGALNGGAQVIGAMAFRRDWLTSRGVNPGNALLVTVTGDSMAPTISAGDIVLLDRARTEVAPPARGRPPRIYIFDDLDGATRLKRLVRLDARTLAVLSDNAADHPPQLLHGADAGRITVHGRVVWWGHTEKEKT